MSFCKLLQNPENLFKTPDTGQVHIQLTDPQAHDVCMRINDTRKKSPSTAIYPAGNLRIIFFQYLPRTGRFHLPLTAHARIKLKKLTSCVQGRPVDVEDDKISTGRE